MICNALVSCKANGGGGEPVGAWIDSDTTKLSRDNTLCQAIKFSSTIKRTTVYAYMGSPYINVFEIHFDGDDRTNTILNPLMDCHDPGRIVQGNQIYTVVLSIMLNSFPSTSL